MVRRYNMKTTTDKLQYLLDTKEAIKNAIASKGVDISNKDAFRSYASKIESIQQSGETTFKFDNDVLFFDYDGTPLYSYSKDEAISLTELPPTPVHDGLICGGWNYTLEDIQSELNEIGQCIIAPFYKTDDDKTRLYIELKEEDDLQVDIFLEFGWSGGKIEWGDGEITEAFSDDGGQVFGKYSHLYGGTGNYVIKLYTNDSTEYVDLSTTLTMGGTDKYGLFGQESSGKQGNGKILKKVELPSFASDTYGLAFQYCYNLESISVYCPHNTYTYMNKFGDFRYCNSLKFILVNKGSNINFNNCSNLEYISINGGLSNKTFSNCCNLKRIPLTNTITTLPSNFINNCNNIKEIKIPSSVKTIGSYSFASCTGLEDIIIPEGVVSLEQNCFQYDYPIKKITFLGDINNITTSVFDGCNNPVIDFSNCTSVPTLSSINSFNNNYGVVKVPVQLYKKWKSSTNWSSILAKISPNGVITECTYFSIGDVKNIDFGNINEIDYTTTAIVNGIYDNGERFENLEVVEEHTSFVGKNTSAVPATKQITETYMGLSDTKEFTHGPYINNCIKYTINVTTISSNTTIFYSSSYVSYFSSMIIDGVETTVSNTYKFSELGKHTIILKVADGVTISNVYQFFYSVPVIDVDLTEFDMSNITSTSSSSGTSRMFYNCSALKKIILPSSIKYLNANMFYGCNNVTKLYIKSISAPTSYSNTFGSGSTYIGYNNRGTGINKLYVPTGATGYDTGYLYSTLQGVSCGFTKVELSEDELNQI